MFAKINHVAIVSEKYALITKFYEAVFGMYQSKTSPKSALTVGDGYVGLNINPRKAGRPAGLDHFGIEVEDVETAFDRMRTKYPDADWVQRPSTRPFAGITANDPDGNVFDISQKDMTNRRDVYVENDGTLNLFGALRTSMATTGYETVKEFQKAEVMVAPALKTEGKSLQRAQGIGMA